MTNIHPDGERHIEQWLESYRLMRHAVQMEALRRLANEAPLLAMEYGKPVTGGNVNGNGR